MAEPVEIPVVVDDKASKPLQGIEASLSSLDASVRAMTSSFSAFAEASRGATGVTTQMIAKGTLLGNIYTSAATAVTAAFVDIASGVKDAIGAAAEFGSQMTALSVKTGEATGTLQKLKFAAEQSGLGFESIIAASRKMQGAVAQGSKDTLKALGDIGLKGGAGIETIIEQLAKIEDPFKRASQAADIFGNKVGPQIARVAEQLSDATKKAEAFGLVVSEKIIKAGNEASDKMSILGQQLKTMAINFGGAILQSGALRSVLDQLAIGFAKVIDFIKDNEEAITAFTDAAITLAADALPSIVEGAIAVADALAFMLTGAGDVAGAIEKMRLSFAAWQASIEIVVAAARLVGDVFSIAFEIAGSAVSTLAGLFESAFDVIGQIISGFAETTEGFLSPFTDAVRVVVIEIVEFFGGAFSAIRDAALEVFGGLVAIVTPIAEAISAPFAAAFQKFGQSVKTAQAAFAESSSRIKADTEKIRSGIGGIVPALQSFSDKIRAGVSGNKVLTDSNKNLAGSFSPIGKAAEEAAAKALKAIIELSLGIKSKIAEASLAAGTEMEKALGKVRADTLSTLAKIDAIAARAPADTGVQEAADAARTQALALEQVQRAAAITAERMKTLGQTNEDVAQSAANLAQVYNLWTSEAAGDVNSLTADALDGLLTKMDQLAAQAPEVGAAFSKMRSEVQAALASKNAQGIFSEQQFKQTVASLQSQKKIEDEIASARVKSFQLQQATAQQLADITGKQLSSQQQLQAAMEAVQVQYEAAVEAANREFEIESEILQKEREQHPERAAAIADKEKELGIHREILIAQAEENREAQKAIALAQAQAAALARVLGAVESIGGAIANLIGPEVAAAFQAAGQAAGQMVHAIDQIGSGDILGGIGNLIQGIQGAVSAFKQATDSASGFQRAMGGALVGAKLGASIGGALAGPVGAGIGAAIGGAAGAIAGIFRKPGWAKAAEAAGKEFGFKVSDELGKAIESTAKELDISFEVASLLHINDAMEESGKSAREFGDSVSDLMEGIASGAIPATEGIEQLDSAFQAVTEDAEKAGIVGDKVTRQLIAQAKATGQLTDSMKGFLQEQSDLAKTGGASFASAFAGIEGSTEEQGRAAAANFISAFNVTLEQEGLVGATDAFRDSFAEMRDTIAEQFGDEFAGEVLGPIGGLFDLTAEGSPFRGAAQLGDSLGQIMTAVANSGQLTADTFTNMGISAKQAFETAIAGGATQEQSLQAILPFLQAAKSASEQYGISLDANTQGLVDQAEAAGFAFPTDPLLKVVDLLGAIATKLGAELPESFTRAGDAAAGLANKTTTAAQVAATATTATVQSAVDGMAVASASASEAAISAAEASTTQLGVAFQNIATDSLAGLRDAFGEVASGTDEAVGAAADSLPQLGDAGELAGTQVADGVQVAITQLAMLEAQAARTAAAIAGIGDASLLTIPGATPIPIPGAAEGDFVPATPGGQLRVVGEGGEGEFIVPESKMGGDVNVKVEIHGSGLSQEQLSRAVADAIRNAEGELLRMTGGQRR